MCTPTTEAMSRTNPQRGTVGGGQRYRGTALIRNRPHLGPYSRPMPISEKSPQECVFLARPTRARAILLKRERERAREMERERERERKIERKTEKERDTLITP